MSLVITPDELIKTLGKLFCQGFYTLVDEKNNIATLIECCDVKGAMEWDIANRKRSGGVLRSIRTDGNMLVMDADLGEGEVNFGPAAKGIGASALKAVKIEGDLVKTTWVGLAGASVGVGVCLAQGPGVIKAEYPEGFKVGGANRVLVNIYTPKMVRVVYAADDTDTKEKGASWVLMLKMARSAPYGKFLEHKITQLNPKVPEKTTNCAAVGVSFAVREDEVEKLTEYVVNYLRENTYSDDTTLAVYQGLKIPQELSDYGLRAKKEILTVDDAKKAAADGGAKIIKITGENGTIGAVAAIGCFDMGLMAADILDE
ncbi:TiaS agmantine-binding domain-containing protein [Candidatus Methanomassiliicoccus intestinalis]|uniref:TiaS agmantine-binding domain-containing protein n=1 Tax=Candidatus Methanomassiliicoccus intestinalis TaxID=1406512 RepID=UPI0037DC8E54